MTTAEWALALRCIFGAFVGAEVAVLAFIIGMVAAYIREGRQ